MQIKKLYAQEHRGGCPTPPASASAAPTVAVPVQQAEEGGAIQQHDEGAALLVEPVLQLQAGNAAGHDSESVDTGGSCKHPCKHTYALTRSAWAMQAVDDQNV